MSPPIASAPAVTGSRFAEAGESHPDLWRADRLGSSCRTVVSTGFRELDDELPGGGWPHRVLTELLLPQAGLGEIRLLAPALAAISTAAADPARQAGRCVMFFDPPEQPAGWVLGRLGIDVRQLFVVHGREGARGAAVLRRVLPSADLMWALEQALKSGHVGAVLAWPPDRLRADAVRRLQLAAARHDGPVFLFRPIAVRRESSPAPLRLALGGDAMGDLSVRVLKRRGPVLTRALKIALPPVLPAAAMARLSASPRQPSPASLRSSRHSVLFR